MSPGRDPTSRMPSSTPGMKDCAVVGVVPDGQRLPRRTEDDLLVGDQPTGPHRVDGHALDLARPGRRPARSRWRPASARGRRPGGRPRPPRPYAGRCRSGRPPCPGGAARRSRPTRRTVPPARRTASSAPHPRRSWGRPGPRRRERPRASRAACASRSSSKPLVPTTAWMPCSTQNCRLAITASGRVRSTATSAPASVSAVSGSAEPSRATSSRSSAASTAAHAARAHPPGRAEDGDLRLVPRPW